MSSGITVRGADQLDRTLRAAGAQLADLSGVNRAAGDLAIARARPGTPVRSGRLVGSLKATATPAGVELGSSLVYAGPIHNGWPAHGITATPFLSDAVRANTDAIVGLYRVEVDAALEGVRGA
jgi:hypothetical protein